MADPEILDFDHGISAVDARFKRPGMAAIHLIAEGQRAALVDIGTNYSVPQAEKLLKHRGIAPENIAYLIVTHVHLDHAGGAGAMLARLPQAQLVVHPRGARHMADPSQLVAGATAVYGETEMRASYGELIPIPQERILQTHDGLTLDIGGRSLVFLDTLGHCRHHHCIYDERSGGIFTGDNFGISYRQLDVAGRPCVIPATAPVQFDPEAYHRSVDRILALRPRWAFMTHFSRVGELQRLGQDLHRLLDGHVAVAKTAQGTSGTERHGIITTGLRKLFLDYVRQRSCTLPEAEIDALFALDVEVNAQGVEVWMDRPTKMERGS